MSPSRGEQKPATGRNEEALSLCPSVDIRCLWFRMDFFFFFPSGYVLCRQALTLPNVHLKINIDGVYSQKGLFVSLHKAVPNGMQDTLVYINAVHFNAVCLLDPCHGLCCPRLQTAMLSPQWRKIRFFVLFCFFGGYWGGLPVNLLTIFLCLCCVVDHKCQKVLED